MLIGLLAFFFIVFFGRLAFRRLHARRCDSFLAPLAKCQSKLVDYHYSTISPKKQQQATNKKNDDDNNQHNAGDNSESSKPTSEDGIPLISVSEIHSSLKTAKLFKTVEAYLPHCPTICVSIGGQRVVWSRSPNLMRRALLTHFRMFPGPPTKSISSYEVASAASSSSSAAEVSSYKATAVSTSVFIGAILEQINLSASLSSASSSSTFENLSSKVCHQLFALRDGEKFWDHVCWQGGFKPGQFPDIPGLLLRGMSSKRDVHFRNKREQELARNLTGSMSTFVQSALNKFGEERMINLHDKNSAKEIAKNSNNGEFVKLFPSHESRKNVANLLVREMLNDIIGRHDGKQFSDRNLIDSISENLLLLNVENSGLLDLDLASSSSTLSSLLFSGGFQSGLSPTSFPLSTFLTGNNQRSSSGQLLGNAFSKLNVGVLSSLEDHITELAEAQEFSTRKSVEVGENSTCGLSVLLANCGSVRQHNRPGETSVMRHADRWDDLLRVTLSHKSAVIFTHLITYAFDLYKTVVQQLTSNPENSFSRIRSHFTDENTVLESYVKEAMRLHPLVRQCVRAVEHDDPQRADLVFGISSDLVKRLNTPEELLSLQTELDAIASGKSTKQLNNTSASKKDLVEQKQKKMQEVIQSKLDPSIRLSMNGMLSTPASACLVCDIYNMHMNKDVFGGDCEKFVPTRWSSGSIANNDAQQRSRMEASFAPLGFGAGAESATRYLMKLVGEMIEETVWF